MEAQAAEALECHLVSDLSILQNTDVRYLSGNLWGEKGGGREPF